MKGKRKSWMSLNKFIAQIENKKLRNKQILFKKIKNAFNKEICMA